MTISKKNPSTQKQTVSAIDWDRKVNKPRLSKRIFAPVRPASIMEQRLIGMAAVIRTMPEKALTTYNLQEVFGRLMYFKQITPSVHEKKAMPLIRKLAKLNKLEDWT